MVLFPPPFFYISNLLSYIQNNFTYELARPIMGTIFLVIIGERSEPLSMVFNDHPRDIYIYYIPPPLTVHFSMTRSMRYQPILHTLYYTLHTEHAYCLSYRFLNNVVITTVIETVEMVEILDGRLGKRSVERVRYVINNLLHLVIVKYGDISLVLCISTRLRLVTILSLLVKYLVILHADPCNKSYILYIWPMSDRTYVSNTHAHVRMSV